MAHIKLDKKGKALTESYEDHLLASLKDPSYASDYLNAALEDEDYRVFLLALRDVANALGVKAVAEEAGLNRESLYKMLSENGNPKLSSVVALLRAIGVRLTTDH